MNIQHSLEKKKLPIENIVSERATSILLNMSKYNIRGKIYLSHGYQNINLLCDLQLIHTLILNS